MKATLAGGEARSISGSRPGHVEGSLVALIGEMDL